MDGERFDQLIRAIGSDASRRRVLKGLGAGVAGALTGIFRTQGIGAQGPCRPAGHPCEGGQDDQCCQDVFELFCIAGSGSGAAERCCLEGSEVCGSGGSAICCPEEASCNAQDECICPNNREFCGFLCCPAGEHCADAETGTCVECLDDGDCSADDCEVCVSGTCEVSCEAPTPFCDGAGNCVECEDNTDCDQANCEVCASGTCTFDCSGDTPNCCSDGTTGTCQECCADSDCDQDACEVCFNGTCAVCPNGGTCDNGTCVDNTCPPRDGKERKRCAGAAGKKDKCCPANPQQPCGQTKSGAACCGGKTTGKCRIVEA